MFEHQFSMVWVSCHLGPAQVPVRLPHFLFRHLKIHPSPLSSVLYLKHLGGSIQMPCDSDYGRWVWAQIPRLDLLTSCDMQ